MGLFGSNHKMTEEQKRELEQRRALEAHRSSLQERKKTQEKNEQKKKKKEEEEERKRNTSVFISSTQHSIPIRDIYHGVVITRDNRYVKIMEFKAQNFQMLPAEKRNAIASGFANILDTTQYKMQFKVMSTKAQTDTLVELMKERRKTETNEMRARLQDEYITMIRSTALSQGVTRRFFIIIEFMQTADNDGSNIDAIVDSLNSVAMSIETQMANIGNLPVVKSVSEQTYLQELFWSILNRRTAEEEPFSTRVNQVLSIYESRDDIPEDQKMNIPATDMIAPPWIDYSHPRHIVVCGTEGDNIDPATGRGKLQNKYYTFGYIHKDTYPIRVAAGWMDALVALSEGIDCDIFIQSVPNDKIKEKIGFSVRWNRSEQENTSDTSTESRTIADTVSSGMFILDSISAGEQFYWVSVLLTVCGDTKEEMEYRFKMLKQTVKSELGATIIRPSYQMEQAFGSALPLCRLHPALERKMRHNIMTGGLSTMYPFLTYEMQDPQGIMMGVNRMNNSLVSVDVFDTDVHTNANGAILGTTGMGKTYTAQLLAMRWCLLGIQTFIITPMKGKQDYARACNQIDGEFIQLGPGSPHHINIFDISIPDNTVEQFDDDIGEMSLLDQKVKSIVTFIGLLYKNMSEVEEGVLENYIYEAYAQKGITSDNSSIFIPGTQTKKEMPVLEDVYNLIENEPMLKNMRAVMTKVVRGSLSCYNKPTNVNLDNKYVVFDLGGKEGEDLSVPMYIVLDYVWGRIKENKLEKKAVLIDEAWQLIGSSSNEKAAEFVRQIFKTIRAFGGAAFVMTQQVEDFFALKDGIYGTAIINNADTKILLGMSPRDCSFLQGVMHLTNSEKERIQSQKRGQGMLVTGGARLYVQFTSSPFEHRVITTDVKELRAAADERKAQKETAIKQGGENHVALY